ncbi:hypothetical protein J6590_096552 [Homalodisca vitripennis]|nr:hypothetical protein J6590_096552 [Homalodisca vitripennis]
MSEISRRCTTTHVTAELALALTQLSERLYSQRQCATQNHKTSLLVDWAPDYNSNEQSRTLTTPTPTLNTLFDTVHRNTTKHTECKYYTTY